MRALLLCLGLLAAGRAEAESCSDKPAGQIFAFEAPPPVPPPLQAALQRGRAYLERGARLASGCGAGAAHLTAGYAVATLRAGRVAFSAPEGLPTATLRCLGQIGRRLPAPPPLPPGAEVRQVWYLRDKAPPPAAPATAASVEGAAGKRTFAEIEAEVRRHLPAITTCLEALWTERPHAGGTLALHLKIAEHGLVEEAGVLRAEPSMAAAVPCLQAIFLRLRFPPRWGLGGSVMSYPIVLQPPPLRSAAN